MPCYITVCLVPEFDVPVGPPATIQVFSPLSAATTGPCSHMDVYVHTRDLNSVLHAGTTATVAH